MTRATGRFPHSGARTQRAGGRLARAGWVLLTVGLALSGVVGALHFFAPYAFAWYSYIPDAPPEIYVSVDYVNFLFSLMLTGTSLVLLLLRRRLFAGSPEALALYALVVLVWTCRLLLAVVHPWPTSLNTWLLVGAGTVLVLLLSPVPHLLGLRPTGLSHPAADRVADVSAARAGGPAPAARARR